MNQGIQVRGVHQLQWLSDVTRVSLSQFIWKGPRPVRMLLLSDGINAHSEAQFDPIFRNRHVLRKEFGLVACQKHVNPAKLVPATYLARYDIIGLKFNYKTPPEVVMRAAEAVAHSKRKDARLIYCDGNDELTIQWPELVGICDLYWKKHYLRDRALSLRRYPGSTNLTSYVLRESGGNHDEETAAAPVDLRKLRLGASVGLDDKIAAYRPYLDDDRMVPEHRSRAIDLILRGDVPDNWMGRLRKPAVEILQSMQGDFAVVLPKGRVPQSQYIQEMMESRICVSPFGYGEICWRDFEAVAFGCLLVKPRMDHVESRPDIFRPFETYVPVEWDFSDLREKIVYYLKNEPERLRIVANARRVLREALRPEWFAGVMRELLENY